MDKVYTVFRPKQRKNPTWWGGTCLYGLYKEYPPRIIFRQLQLKSERLEEL